MNCENCEILFMKIEDFSFHHIFVYTQIG